MSSNTNGRSASEFRHTILAAQRSGHRVLADMIRSLGLTPAWAEVLTVLKENGALSIRELSKFLICEADHPSRLIKRMEDKGFVHRAQNQDDKRAVRISLTDQGEAAALKVVEIEHQFDIWITSQISQDAIDDTCQTLGRLLKGTEEAKSLRNRYS